MLVYVISLKKATAKRERIVSRLDALGISHEVVDAVDGHTLDLSKYEERLDDRFVTTQRGFGLVRGEIGCFLSHYNLWERMVSKNMAQAVILEDDAILSDDFRNVIDSIQTLEWRWEVIRLSSYFRRGIARVVCPIGERYHLVRYKSTAQDTAAYAISLKGAKVLCKHCYIMSRPIDNLYEQWWKANLHFFAVYPPPVSQTLATEGAIQSERAAEIRALINRNRSWLDKLWSIMKHFILRVYNRHHRRLWNAFNPPEKLKEAPNKSTLDFSEHAKKK